MISVVIPTHRRPDLLARLLASISAQTLIPSEVIVVDDASGMREAYLECLAQFHDYLPNLRYECLNQNAGAPHARNVGIRLAAQPWIALVDDDDEWLPEKLARQALEAQRCSPSTGLIYTWCSAQGSEGLDSYMSKHVVMGDARSAILETNFILSPTVLIKKQALLDAGLFDEELPSCQDWDMWTRIFLAGYGCSVVPEVLAIYHRHGGESIGLSHRAQLGYKRFVEKHWRHILKYTGPINVLKKLRLYFQVSRSQYGRS